MSTGNNLLTKRLITKAITTSSFGQQITLAEVPVGASGIFLNYAQFLGDNVTFTFRKRQGNSTLASFTLLSNAGQASLRLMEYNEISTYQDNGRVNAIIDLSYQERKTEVGQYWTVELGSPVLSTVYFTYQIIINKDGDL